LIQITPFQKFGIALVIAGVLAVLGSFAIPAHDDEIQRVPPNRRNRLSLLAESAKSGPLPRLLTLLGSPDLLSM
jgi:hypothetical protein